MTLSSVTAAEARRLVEEGALLIDIRRPDEHARERIPGSKNQPVDSLTAVDSERKPIIFHCMSGLRTQIYEAKLAVASGRQGFVLEGGLEAWKKDGLPVIRAARHADVARNAQMCRLVKNFSQRKSWQTKSVSLWRQASASASRWRQ